MRTRASPGRSSTAEYAAPLMGSGCSSVTAASLVERPRAAHGKAPGAMLAVVARILAKMSSARPASLAASAAASAFD